MAEINSVAIYCRVANNENAELDLQIKRMREVAGKLYPDARTQMFSDTGAAMREDKLLPGMARLMESAGKREFDAVVAASPSRITRNAANALGFQKRMSELGITVRYADETNPPDPWLLDSLDNIEELMGTASATERNGEG